MERTFRNICRYFKFYKDTEGSFSVTRFKQLLTSHHSNLLPENLDRIKIYRIKTLLELKSIWHQLEMILNNEKNVRLLIFDSFAFHFRSQIDYVYYFKSR
jgi:RecA/RadA recombinase